ncbi:LysR substrate-binding domain-containing protein [Variovorax terrae]|uniref:LysR substrate-binding domain-containing protein n=1 Tax=Variovorax terrae TaxID=2923278 RepID=A0A9X2AQW1_9BURK|nr:LysR substrate-binding domain-containing protein [Variovorax terrae]MCJ0763611.1 LysR substrate-binding domain-containing protein [Variovorax terrae]
MKVHQLRYLAVVAAEGSIRAAARALGLTQATVTQGLRELEANAQVALLTRHGSGIALTPAGQDLVAHAQRVLAQLRQAEDTLARHRDSAAPQRLSVGITPWVAQTLMPRVVPAFRAALPHVQIEMFDGLSVLAYPRLREGSLDLMIGRIAADDAMQGLQALPLFSYEMTVVTRRGHPRAGARSIAELLEDDWILNFTPGEQAALMHNLFGQHGVAPPRQRIHLAHSASLMLTLVQQTDMLTFCPWPLVETEGLRTSLLALQLRERFRTNTVGIIRRAQETPTHAAACFIELFLAEVRAWARSDEPAMRRVLHSVDLLEPASTQPS